MINMYDTRELLEALIQMLPVKTFLLDTFFRSQELHLTGNVDIDVEKGKRRLAPFVSPLQQGKLVEKRGYNTETYTPPYVKPKMVTTAEDMLKRMIGNHIYSGGMTGADYAAVQLGKELAILDEMITRREEWMAAQALLTGAVVCTGDGISQSIDFQMDASHKITLTSTDLWSDTTNSAPLEDCEDWAELVAKDSGLTVDTIIMGKDAARAFVNHPDVQKKADNLRMFMTRITPDQIKPGARLLGAIDAVSNIYVYHEWYWNGSANVPLMDPKKVILGSTQARAVRHYGAIQDLDSTASVSRFPKSWTENDPSARMLMLQSAPLPVPHQIDGFVVAQVLA